MQNATRPWSPAACTPNLDGFERVLAGEPADEEVGVRDDVGPEGAHVVVGDARRPGGGSSREPRPLAERRASEARPLQLEVQVPIPFPESRLTKIGLPPSPCEPPESWVQYLRKRCGCQRRTVSGVTNMRDQHLSFAKTPSASQVRWQTLIGGRHTAGRLESVAQYLRKWRRSCTRRFGDARRGSRGRAGGGRRRGRGGDEVGGAGG
jgi:hypothetical protein